jgi:hypothetical protein
MNQPDENQRILRELPPRHLDWLTQAVMMCGDIVSQTGWALLAIGSVFFWTTAVNSEVKYFFEQHSKAWENKAGVILEADSTGVLERDQPVWRYRHSFALDDYRYLGTSYSVGKKFDSGQIAFISYDPDDPTINYITGLRRSPHRWQVNLLLLIPLFGLIFVLHALRYNLRILRLLKIGDFTRGEKTEKMPTGQTVKEGVQVLPVFKYLFRFEYEEILYLASCRTHQTNLVEDEATESILFDRYNPTFNLVYDAVPNVPVINSEGKMEAMPGWKSWVLFLPLFTIAVNLIFLLLK